MYLYTMVFYTMYKILKCIVFIIKISSNIKVIIHLILQISLTLYFSTTKNFKTDIQIVLSFTFYHCHVHVIVWPNYELHHSLESKSIIKNSKKKLKNLNKLIQIHVIFSMLYNELVIKKTLNIFTMNSQNIKSSKFQKLYRNWNFAPCLCHRKLWLNRRK